MDKLVLADIQALAASSDYGGGGFIQPSSAALGLSAAFFLSDLSMWQGAGYELTDAEIDDIQAMIAQLENDLIQTGGMYQVDKVKAIRTTNQSIASGVTTGVAFNVEEYDTANFHNPLIMPQRFWFPSDGLYLINAGVQFAAAAVGYRMLLITKHPWDGPDEYLSIQYMQDVDASSPIGLETSFQDEFKEDDYIIVYVAQTSGAPLNLLAWPMRPYCAIMKAGA